jgi:hypothetical protein
MGMFDNEVAADNQMRKYDRLSRSTVSRVTAQIGQAAGAVADAASSSPISRVRGMLGIADLIRRLGVPTVEENLDFLGDATEEAISRVERALAAQGKDTNDLRQRIESDEFKDGLAAAVLQTQRTREKSRLKRMALILANSASAEEFELEGLDDMLRAAVELKEADIALLRRIYESQISLVNQQLRPRGQSPEAWHGSIQRVWREFVSHGDLNPQEHLQYRSSFARLEALGLVQHLNFAGSYGVGRDIYALLVEGKMFCERIGEIAE